MMGRGDCYEVAGLIALRDFKKVPMRADSKKNIRAYASKGLTPSEEDWSGTPYVVHAQVEGQGALQGIPYGHAWVEDNLFVYDFSNGRSIRMLKDDYYYSGNVQRKKPKYFKYTFPQAVAKMAQTGHYGSWDLITDSGL